MIKFNDKNFDFATVKMENIVNDAEIKAKKFAQDDKVKTNQIRNFFAAISKMRVNFSSAEKDKKYQTIQNDLILLKPKLAYAAGRQRDVRNFQQYVTQAIDAVIKSNDKEKATENFFALIESIVAYHKFYGGKDN
jgi:CRISPR-associated protein Csm2